MYTGLIEELKSTLMQDVFLRNRNLVCYRRVNNFQYFFVSYSRWSFHTGSYGSSFEVTAQHQDSLGSNSIVNDAMVVGVQVITVVAQVILTGVTAVLRSSSESHHPHPPQKIMSGCSSQATYDCLFFNCSLQSFWNRPPCVPSHLSVLVAKQYFLHIQSLVLRIH